MVTTSSAPQGATENDGVQTNERSTERSFRLLVQGVIDYAIYMLSPEGIISNWNAGAERIKGYSEAEIVGRHFRVFYTEEDDRNGLPDRALEIARREGRYESEGWRVRKDGTQFLASVVIDAISENGKLIGFAKITRDITERKKHENALHDSESKFRLLVSGVSDYALYMLDPQGIVSNWNLGGQRIKGYSPEEIIGQHFSRFYTPADQANGRPARAIALAEKNGRYEEEGWRVRKDGTFFWASVVIDAIRDESGKLLGFAKITRDITERREAQQGLERIQQQLAESQKLDALGQLTGGVAHDFNNLLMIISGNIFKLKKLVGDDPLGRRSIEAVELATRRGADLTKQLLTFARRQRVNPEPLDIAERINAVFGILETGLGGAISLLKEIEPGLWPVVADTTELETALVNLIVNARDAMPEGGSVTIEAKNVTLKNTLHPGDHVAITVRDSGVGIPPDVIPKIFDPFFTTKPVGKGTGLGLSQVHGFAHQAGGTISVSSELNKGTSFTICLPRGAAEQASTVRQGVRGTPGTGKVLLVEDNPDVANASAGFLEQLGYSVHWVSGAAAALEEVERNGFDLIVSDIVMPGNVDGLNLARTIRSSHPHLPILLTTGYSDAALKAGSEFPILRKPYLIHELSSALAKLR
jgi:PAS domain S-box-containing protein